MHRQKHLQSLDSKFLGILNDVDDLERSGFQFNFSLMEFKRKVFALKEANKDIEN